MAGRGWLPGRRGLLRAAALSLGAAAIAGFGLQGSAGAVRPPVPASPLDAAGTAADRYLSELAAARVFRGTALIAAAGRVLLAKGYDWADAALAAPNTQHTRFRIASVTKQFTALAILQLQDRGLLAVGDPLSAHLPDTPPAWRGITLRQLLTHTSGIPDYFGLPGFAALSQQRVSPGALIAFFRDQPLAFAPGSRWSYSDSGYVLLGRIIARLSGVPYARYLGSRVFGPLGLAGTGYDTDNPRRSGHAAGYSGWTARAAFIDVSVLYAAGGLYSTVGDLWRWDTALASGAPTLLSPAAMEAMFTPQVATGLGVARSASYGYGWFIGSAGGRPLYSHVGSINGFESFSGFFPQAGVTVAVLSNLDSGAVPADVAMRLAGAVFGQPECLQGVGVCAAMA